jgi:formylglycine-generating enzyme required for sulfatase activity
MGKDIVKGLNTKQFPVEMVSWNDAQACCTKMSKNDKQKRKFRLPTEAEWEYACRAGTKTAYYFGDDPKKLDEYAWYQGNSADHPHPVGEKKPNEWHLYDMHGNVFQWCEDYYGPYKGLEAKDPLQSRKDPEGRRVLRGGSAVGRPQSCRAAYRMRNAPDNRHGAVGFRVCFSLD